MVTLCREIAHSFLSSHSLLALTCLNVSPFTDPSLCCQLEKRWSKAGVKSDLSDSSNVTQWISLFVKNWRWWETHITVPARHLQFSSYILCAWPVAKSGSMHPHMQVPETQHTHVHAHICNYSPVCCWIQSAAAVTKARVKVGMVKLLNAV